MKEKTVETTRFGTLSTEGAIKFNEGVYGFEGFKNWKLMHFEGEKLYWLQSLDDGTIAFPLVHASTLGEDQDVFYILTIPRDVREMTANTKAPIAISGKNGEQIMAGSGMVNKPVYRLIRKAVINL